MSVPTENNGNAVVPMAYGTHGDLGQDWCTLPFSAAFKILSCSFEPADWKKKGMWLPLKLMRKVDKPSPLQNLLLQPKRFPSSKNIPTIPSAQRLSNPSFFVSASNMSYASPAFQHPRAQPAKPAVLPLRQLLLQTKRSHSWAIT